MSAEREIVRRLRESRMIKESEFTSGGSTYKCVFGKYYKDGEQISREEYFRVKERASSSGKSYDSYSTEEFEDAINDIESKIDDISFEIEDIHPQDRDEYEDALEDMADQLNAMEEYLSDEQYERTSKLITKIHNLKDADYSGSSNFDHYSDIGMKPSDFY